MAVRWLLCWLVLGVSSASAQPRIGDELVTDPAVWRAFRPFVISAGDDDATRAVAYLRAGNRLLRKIEGNLERDAPTQKFYEAASESYEELDLRGLMALLPEQDGEFRRFAVQGRETASAYRLSVPKGDFEVNATSARRGFGEGSSVLRMRHLKTGDGKRYLVQARAGIGVGNVQWSSIVRGASDAIALVEESVVRPVEEKRPMVVRTADAFLRKTQPKLAAEDRRVLATQWASFPEVAKVLTAIGGVEDVIDLPRTSGGLTHLRLVAHFDLERMEQRYPELADFLDDFGDLVELKIQLRDANDNTLADVWLDSGRMLVRVEAYLRDGGLVPSRAGKPLRDAAPDFRRMEAHVHVHAHAVGIHMYVDDLRVEMAYTASLGARAEEPRASTGALAVRVRHTPGFRVEGRALGLIPASVLDWFIPGDIPGLARRMFDIASKGNEGQGVVLDYRFATRDGQATMDAQVGVEVLDTALIRFGMKVAADRVIPDEAESADIRKLWVTYRDAFARDLERFARYGKPTVQPTSTPTHILQPF